MHEKRIKLFTEQREAAIEEMEGMIAAAVDENGEERAMTEEERGKFEALEAKVQRLTASIEAEEQARALMMQAAGGDDTGSGASAGNDEGSATAEERAESEERAFADYIRGVVTEERADANLTASDNGAVIPTTIANKIIQKVYDICPIYAWCTRYNVKGTLQIPYYPAAAEGEEPDITMGYASEFAELESTSGKFRSIELQSFLAGVLTKVSKSLINNSQFDIVNFVIDKMAENIARWLEKELINGTPGKVTGLSTAEQIVESAANTAITSDELIDLQEAVPDVFQANAVWIMNRATRTYLRKLKDGEGNYLLERDFTAKWGYRLLGKDVYVTDSMATLGTASAGKPAIYYGDFSGLALKVSEEMEINVLRERFATEHVLGVYAYMELDAKIENQQKIAALKLKA